MSHRYISQCRRYASMHDAIDAIEQLRANFQRYLAALFISMYDFYAQVVVKTIADFHCHLLAPVLVSS